MRSGVLIFQHQNNFVIGKINHVEKHPNADKLKVCKVDIGTAKVDVVCGAPNVLDDTMSHEGNPYKKTRKATDHREHLA